MSLSFEERAVIVARRTAQRSAKRAALAIVEGRIPGKCGPKALSKDEKISRRRENYNRWREGHKDVDAVRSRNRRALKKGNGGSHTAADIRELFFEQKGLCGLCNLKLDADNFHVDHWKPISKGGSNDKGNLKLLHPMCNLMKSDKLPEELAIAN